MLNFSIRFAIAPGVCSRATLSWKTARAPGSCIAPGHGLDDYNLGRQNGLPIYSPVDDNGAFTHTNDLPIEQQMPAHMIGKAILEKHGKSEANEVVLEELRAQSVAAPRRLFAQLSVLLAQQKTPVIFRAMDQWFISIDHQNFRQKASRRSTP